MQPYNKEEAIRKINEFSLQKKPFIFIINYLQDSSYIIDTQEVDQNQILYNFNGINNIPSNCFIEDKEVEYTSYPESFEEYYKSFSVVKQNILAGNSFLANLTCQTPIKTNLSLKEIFMRSNAMYKLWMNGQFVFFSPEIFIRIIDGKIHSYPMKGTIDATIPNAHQRLMDDKKEAAEHATIVDLIRNDLSIVSNHVFVKRYRYVDQLKTLKGSILQSSSEVVGTLPDNYLKNLGNIIFSLLPAGSITGAPKHKTMQIISDAENYERGFYTGVSGYFDGKNIDSAVMIRFIEENNEQMYFKSGGGITYQSDVNSEYNEMKQKIYVPIY